MASKQQAKGYSLVELLVVIAIMAILLGFSSSAVPALLRGDKVSAGISTLNQTLAQARQYAISNNTYVWVLLSPPSTSSSTPDQPLRVAVLASLTGTDCLNWQTTPVSYPSASAPGSQMQMVSTITDLHGVSIQNTPGVTLTSTPPSSFASLNESMTINIQYAGQTVPFTYAVQFTPMGEALVSSSMSRYIEFDVYPQHSGSGSPNNSPDQAVLCIAGLTGATTLYRN
jgi:prepilin-type N-terminal cleavage/methylation domain-containing protein